MENLIVFLIIAVVTIVNIVRNYKKEQKKNKGRAQTQQPRPANRNTRSTTSSTPPPFSRRHIENIPTDIPQYTETTVMDNPTVYLPVTDVVSDILESSHYEEGESALKSRIERGIAEEENRQADDRARKGGFAMELNLDNRENVKKAFVYSLIFDRKY